MPFVSAGRTHFTLDGEPFRVAGANNYYLGFASDAMVQSVFDLALKMGMNILRTWAFLDCGSAAPGAAPLNAKDGIFFHYLNTETGKPDFNDGPDGLERLDRTIALAEQTGIRLILPLVNYWDDFGGVNQYLAWFELSGKEQFYRHPDVRRAYRDYVEHLLLRINTRTGRQYRDEPAIFAWELANEPRDPVLAWADEMSSLIRSLDPNHLIGVGDEGFNGERLLALPNVDFGTCHLYPEYKPRESPAKFGKKWIRKHLEAGARANKPVLIEEFGLRITPASPFRDDVFRIWLDEIEGCNGAGALLWMIAGIGPDGQFYPDYDRFTVYSAEEVPSFRLFRDASRLNRGFR